MMAEHTEYTPASLETYSLSNKFTLTFSEYGLPVSKKLKFENIIVQVLSQYNFFLRMDQTLWKLIVLYCVKYRFRRIKKKKSHINNILYWLHFKIIILQIYWIKYIVKVNFLYSSLLRQLLENLNLHMWPTLHLYCIFNLHITKNQWFGPENIGFWWDQRSEFFKCTCFQSAYFLHLPTDPWHVWTQFGCNYILPCYFIVFILTLVDIQ